jgi:hypothetical protein
MARATPKYEVLFLKYRDPPLWPTSYISERRTNFSQSIYGIKVRCYGEHVDEHIANLGNIVRA